jgi:hypothetical protein
MAFSKLSPAQITALTFIIGSEISDKTPPKLKALIASKDWKTLSVLLSLATPPGTATPSEDDFASVGNLPQGQQNVQFLLFMIDTKATDDAKQQFQQALDSHCWDKVADALRDALKATGLQFTGNDLHQVYAPNDNAPCKGPTDFEKVLGEIVKDGKLVGDFFSQSLPNFFEHDFANFFKDTIPDFFSGPFADFFKDIGNQIAHGFEDMANTLKDVFENLGDILGKALDPRNW